MKRWLIALLCALCISIFAFAQVTTNPSVSGVFLNTLASVVAALGYTPVNKAGDTMTGPLALANGATGQSIQAYNIKTDASNYELGTFDWTTTANRLTIGTQSIGTGTARGLNLSSASTNMDFQTVGTTRAELGNGYFSGIGAGAMILGLSGNGWKQLYIDYTNTATVGAVAINKAAGRVNLGAGGTTMVVTDSLVTAATHCFLNADSAPGNIVAVMLQAVSAAGSFTINAVPAVTNQTAIDFFCVNAD